jgi:Fis family transcriptional regulator
MSRNNIEEIITKSLEKYFRDLYGERPGNLYDMVVLTVERPMLEVVMKHAEGNQSLASDMLGINRNTLRKKLQQHGMI